MKWRWLVLGLIAVVCMCATFLTHADPTQTDTTQFLQPPSFDHVLGTDHLGRDIWSRWLWGGQRTLILGGAASLLGIGGAIVLTGAALLLPESVRRIAIGLIGSFVTIPPLIIGLLVLIVVGRGLEQMAIAAALAQIPSLVSVLVARGVMSYNKEYILAAKSMGASHFHIVIVHVRRYSQPTILTLGVLNTAYALGMIATFGFLGLGEDVGYPEWGLMIAEGRYSFLNAPWVPVAPGIALTIVIGIINSLAKHYEASSGD